MHKVFTEGVYLLPKCKMLKLKFDASSVMVTGKKHQNHSVQIPEKKRTHKPGRMCIIKGNDLQTGDFRDQIDFMYTNQQIYQEILKGKILKK